MPIGSSKLAGESLQHKNQLADYVKLLLLWMAAGDGELEESELEYVSAQFPDIAGTIGANDFLAVIRDSDLKMIAKAIRFVAAESRELRTAFIDMAITLSMADHDIAVAENHILRFYADAVHLGLGNLQKRFQAITGVALPEPGDPSSPAWWDQVTGSRKKSDQGDESRDGDSSESVSTQNPPGPGMSIAQAHTILGLSLNATAKDIELAYRNMARVFNVDQEEAMGSATVSDAHARFRKIQQAYRLLRN
jgi:hypothetical protein